jgi:hypothetical protein
MATNAVTWLIWDGDLIAKPTGTCPLLPVFPAGQADQDYKVVRRDIKTGGGVMFGSEEILALSVVLSGARGRGNANGSLRSKGKFNALCLLPDTVSEVMFPW